MEENHVGGGAFRSGGKQGEKHIPATQAVVLNEGEVSRRSQPLACGGVGSGNHFRGEPDGLEGVTGGKSRSVGAGWDPRRGAGVSRDRWRGLGVERSIGRAEGASGVTGGRRPSSPTSMASSLSEKASDSSSPEGGGASGWDGRTGLALHCLEKVLWSSPQFGQWGGEVGQQLETALVSPPLGQVGF